MGRQVAGEASPQENISGDAVPYQQAAQGAQSGAGRLSRANSTDSLVNNKLLEQLLLKSRVIERHVIEKYASATVQQHQAAKLIQRAWKKYQKWNAALATKRAYESRGKTNKDRLSWLWLFLFNICGMVAAFGCAFCVWYYIISDDTGLGASTSANWLLVFIQLAVAMLCAFGLWAASPKRLELLRLYSFLVLLLCAAQLSALAMFTLDQSDSVKRLKRDTYETMIDKYCKISKKIDEAIFADDTNETAANETNAFDSLVLDTSAMSEDLGDMCVCSTSCDLTIALNATHDLTQRNEQMIDCKLACMDTFLDKGSWRQVMTVMFLILITLQILTANRAWKFMHIPLNRGTPAGDMKTLRLWLQANDLEVYFKRFVMTGINSKKAMIDCKVADIAKVGLSERDTRKFFAAQSKSRVEMLDEVDGLGLSGWDKLDHGLHTEDMFDTLSTNIKVMTKTWYYELCVLVSVGLCMYVLARDSPAYPPDDDTAVFLRSLTFFITIFLTLEMSLELVVEASSFKSAARYLCKPWHVADLLVLLCFWLYLMYPSFMSLLGDDGKRMLGFPNQCPTWISVLRTARVFRPLRTLRMLSDISIVAECFAESVHLFRDAILLATFLLSLFSMICVSSFAGTFHYTCVTCDESLSNVDSSWSEGGGCPSYQRLVFEDHQWKPLADVIMPDPWNDNTTLFRCPDALGCAVADSVDLIEYPDARAMSRVQCVKRTEPLGVGEDEYGTRSFDDMRYAFYTMFITMSGDNGMQDIPNALFDVDATSQWMAWPLFAISAFLLTYVALNLFLAICTTVFYDIHTALEQSFESKRQAQEMREKVDKHVVSQSEKSAEEGGALTAVLGDVLSKVDVTATELLSSASDLLTTNPLGDIDEDRAQVQEYLARIERQGGSRGWLASIVKSSTFELGVMCLIVAFSAVIFIEETGKELAFISTSLVWVELALIVCFVLEVVAKASGLGVSTYFSFGENRLDFIILLACIVGHIASHILRAKELEATQSEDVSIVEVDLSNHDFLRLLKMLRIWQMFRMTYKYQRMRNVLSLVFKTASSVIYLVLFVIAVLGILSIVGMRILGGGCNPQLVEEVPDDCEYPFANFETFSNGFKASFQIMTGEDWSEIMFWYIKYCPIKDYAAIFFMFAWLFLNGIVFNLFIAVLLLNFGMAESAKLPAQKEKFDKSAAKKATGEGGDEIRKQIVADEQDQTSGSILSKAHFRRSDYIVTALRNQAATLDTDGNDTDIKSQHRSLNIFFLDNPIRIFCATIESHPLFEGLIVSMVLLSCFSIAIEGPSCKDTEKDVVVNISGTVDGIDLSQVIGTSDTDADMDPEDNECIALKYKLYFETLNIFILALFYVELIFRSISRGFVQTSGTMTPFLRSGYNQVDMLIIIVCTSAYVTKAGVEEEGDMHSMVGLIQSLIPTATLIRNKNLRRILGSFAASLPMIAVVCVPIIFMMCMMSIVGVDLFGRGKMARCVLESDVLSYMDDYEWITFNITVCEGVDGLQWQAPPYNFEDAFAGVNTLLKCATVGVVPVQQMVRDITSYGQPPENGAFADADYFFMAFHMVFTFFLMNLFIGVMSESFSESTGSVLVTTLQRRWIQCNESLLSHFVPQNDEQEEFRPMLGEMFYLQRLRCFKLVTNRLFSTLTTAVIVVNCVMLSADHYPQSEEWRTWVEAIDVGFLAFYSLEMCAKMFGFGIKNYFKSNWNRFDFSLVSISLYCVFNGTESGIQSLRVMRSFRLFLLMHKMPGLTGLVDTIINCLKPALTITVVMGIIFYVYAVVGMRIYGDASTDHSYYNEKQNFSSFTNAIKLLFQVMLGQNYMFLAADLMEDGFAHDFIFAYFFSFYVLNVFILLNLFTIIVLSTFDAKAPVGQTIGPIDLWAFTHAWAEQTIGAGACSSLQNGFAAKLIRNLEAEATADGQEAEETEGDAVIEDESQWMSGAMPSPRSADRSVATPRTDASPRDGKPLIGTKVLHQKHKQDMSRPTGVVWIKLVQLDSLTIFDKEYTETIKHDKAATVRPYMKLFSKPNGTSHPLITKFCDLEHGAHGTADIDFGDTRDFQLFLDKSERAVSLQLTGNHESEILATAQVSVRDLAKCTNAEVLETMELMMFGAQRPIAEATAEDRERIRNSMIKSPRTPARNGSPSSAQSRSPKGGDVANLSLDGAGSVELPETFAPVVGTLTINCLFTPGIALPKFDFMSQFGDNYQYKTGTTENMGCGLEGWLWKRSTDTFASWERRWMWFCSDPPQLCYYSDVDSEQELERVGRNRSLKVHVVPAADISKIQDYISGIGGSDDVSQRKLTAKEAALQRCELQFASGKGKKQTHYRFRAMSEEQKAGWLAALRWLAGEGEGGKGKSCEGPRPDRIAHATLNDRDVVRVKNNPSLCAMPFCRARHLLSSSVFRATELGAQFGSTRQNLIYTLFNLEMHAMQHTGMDSVKSEALKSHIGEYLSEIRGLDYMMVLRRLCLLHYGKNNSLPYQLQVEEYRHELNKVALSMIRCAVSRWIFSTALPRLHKRVRKEGKKKRQQLSEWPPHPFWRQHQKTYIHALNGVYHLRMTSLKILMEAVKLQQPPLMTRDERKATKDKDSAAPADSEDPEPAGLSKYVNPMNAKSPKAHSKFNNPMRELEEPLSGGDSDNDMTVLVEEVEQINSWATMRGSDEEEDEDTLTEEELAEQAAQNAANKEVWYLAVFAQFDDKAPSKGTVGKAKQAAEEAGALAEHRPDPAGSGEPKFPAAVEAFRKAEWAMEQRGPPMYSEAERLFKVAEAIAQSDSPETVLPYNPGHLSQPQAAKLLQMYYAELLESDSANAMSASEWVSSNWEMVCANPNEGLSYTDWRKWDAHIGGLRFAGGSASAKQRKRTKHQEFVDSHSGKSSEIQASNAQMFGAGSSGMGAVELIGAGTASTVSNISRNNSFEQESRRTELELEALPQQ
jgi:hypothetical protein